MHTIVTDWHHKTVFERYLLFIIVESLGVVEHFVKNFGLVFHGPGESENVCIKNWCGCGVLIVRSLSFPGRCWMHSFSEQARTPRPTFLF